MYVNPCSPYVSCKSIHSYLPLALIASLFAFVFARYQALSTNVFDFGLVLSAFASVNNEWFRAFYGHVHPLMFLGGLGDQILPPLLSPYIFVGLQAAAILAGVAIVWRYFGNWAGFAIILYYPLWANALLDFHFDHLAVPLMAMFFLFCKKRWYGWAALVASVLVLIKEPFALQTSACGVYFIWLAWRDRSDESKPKRLVTFGSLLLLWGGIWFYAATHWVLPYFGDMPVTGLKSPAFGWMGYDPWQMIVNLVTRPDRLVLEIISTPGKLAYLAVVFGLLAFIPLLRPAALIPALPVLVIAMIAKGQPLYYSYANHYTAGVIVPAIMAFREGLPVADQSFCRLLDWTLRGQKVVARWALATRQRVFAIMLASWIVAGHVIFASSPISRLFWLDKVWSYSWRAYVPTDREEMMKGAMLKFIPADPDVSVSSQNTLNWGYLAQRKVYLAFPMGVETPHKVMDWSNRNLQGLWTFVRTGYKPLAVTHDRYADYVVLDLQRPYFVGDKGCDWIYGKCRDKVMEKTFLDYVAFTRKHYEAAFEQDGFIILRRRFEEAATPLPASRSTATR